MSVYVTKWSGDLVGRILVLFFVFHFFFSHGLLTYCVAIKTV